MSGAVGVLEEDVRSLGFELLRRVFLGGILTPLRGYIGFGFRV